MQTFLFIIITIIIVIIGLDMLIYFVIAKRPENRTQKNEDKNNVFQEEPVQEEDEDEIIVVDVEFKGYKGTFTYSVEQENVYKGQYVLVLTRDGIRCAEVVTDSKTIKQSQLRIPPFLLENIICIADEVDLEYYS